MQALEQRFTVWAMDQPNIRAAVVVGSRARDDHPADDWADLDVMVYAENPDTYLGDSDWLGEIGTVWASFVYVTSGDDPEQLVVYEGGLNVDFVVVSINTLRRATSAGTVPEIFLRGARVIVDKDAIADEAVPNQFHTPGFRQITQEDLVSAVNTFWYAALYIAKQLRRGELWLALYRLNETRNGLLGLVEAHARAVKGQDHDTWHMGRFLTEWAEPRVVEALGETFPQFTFNDGWRALWATIDLFRWLAKEIAKQMGFRYPETIEERMAAAVKTLYLDTSAPGG